MNTAATTFGVRLRAWRHRADVMIHQVASAVGVSPTTVLAWELGQARPTYQKVVALAEALGVDVMEAFDALHDDNVTVASSSDDVVRLDLAELTIVLETLRQHAVDARRGRA